MGSRFRLTRMSARTGAIPHDGNPTDQLVTTPVSAVKHANPAPLGLVGFGLTTVVLSCINAGLLPPAAVSVVVPLAFAYGGIAQIIAGVLEFKTGNTFGLFWWWFAFLKWTTGSGWLTAPPASAIAVTLLMWGVFTFFSGL